MQLTFEKFLEPIRDKTLSIGERRFYAIREVTLTNQVNAELERIGDIQGQEFGKEYLKALKALLAKEGLNVS